MWIALLVLSILLCVIIIGISVSAPKYKGPVSDHFDGKKFINPKGVKAKDLGDVLKWVFNRKRGEWKEIPEEYGKHPLTFYKDGIRVTFINHSTFLIQVDGLNILTDPIWSERASPFTWIGPKRKRKPGIRMEDLPKIDLVLLSHNHYDHLDIPTMRVIVAAHHPVIITPLGVKRFLDQHYISGSSDVDWWSKISINDHIQVQAVPAQHFSGRGMLDRDATLWCGYIIKTTTGNIYFAGDTGYNDTTFKEIRTRCGEIQLSLLPIGAYKPAWFMSPIHTSPEDAVKIHLDVQSRMSIASHFGTFPLADEGYDEPMNDLQSALKKYDLPEDRFLVMKEGSVYE